MRIPHSLLAIVASLFLSTISIHAQDTVTDKKVLSGTSFETSTGEKVSLLGISQPKSQAIYAEDMKGQLASLIGERVVLVADTTLGADKKGQRLRYVYSGDRLINLQMITDGYSFAVKSLKHARLDEFAAAEKDARQQQIAAWSSERVVAIQCQGTTKKGAQCSRSTSSLSGRCWQHG